MKYKDNAAKLNLSPKRLSGGCIALDKLALIKTRTYLLLF